MISKLPPDPPEVRARDALATVNMGNDQAHKDALENSELRYNRLLKLQAKADVDWPGYSVASDEVWLDAWKEKEEYYRLKNLQKESHSDPSPLLVDKISSLPPSSAERRNSETVKQTLDNTTDNVGGGLDTLTRESYKETKKLVKQSDMLQEGVREPLPSKDSLVGEEEGTVVSNLQSWKPALTNAVKPLSDATGSHSDTASSVVKTPMGTEHSMPASVSSTVDGITPHMTNHFDSAFKAVHMDGMQHMPSKAMGSLRQLATASDPILKVPFEIASDVYNGLLHVMDEIANMGDVVMSALTSFIIGPVGGLVNGLFPVSQLKGLLGPLGNIASLVGDLNSLLGGFSALTQMANALGGIVSSLSSILNNASKLAGMIAHGANVAGIVGGSAGKSLGCVGKQLNMSSNNSLAEKTFTTLAKVEAIGGILGSIDRVGSGLGNLGAILGGGISAEIGQRTKNLRYPEQIIPGILPPELASAMKQLDQMCGFGMVGNMGFSVGNSMDSLRDSAFSKCMKNYAAHAAIVSPLFNKECKPTGAYAQEASIDFFNESKYTKGAQEAKGVLMIGPGSTSFQKPFGVH